MGIRQRRIEQVLVVRSVDETGVGDSPDHTSCASRTPGSRVLFDAGRSYLPRPSSSLGRAAGPGTLLDRLEWLW
jgi:hypothetical protein